jgi:hexosaminidase
MDSRPGTFEMRPTTQIVTDAASGAEGTLLSEMLGKATGYRLVVAQSSGADRDVILIQRDADPERLGREGYRLDVTPEKVTLSAPEATGIFYGLQTIRQLLPAEILKESTVRGVAWTMPCVSIEDVPRFPWRGLMLDVCRHFMPKEFVKKFIDTMALHKFNVFHWHLTEDQGWRIEIRKYPRLTEIGSRRAQTVIGRNTDRGDGKPHGGFYTHGDIREVVAYAAARHITVVPEIEMPGHAMAALASYPELACAPARFKVMEEWGISHDVYCAGNERVFVFLEDVLMDVMELFPGEFIHIGGDECPKDRWEACPKCQARMKAQGLKDGRELQSYFVRRVGEFLASSGRRLVGWDEILEGGLAPGATVMSWRGLEGGIAAAKAGHDVVMAPNTHTYLDHYQSQATDAEPPAIGGYLPLEKVYQFEPVPAELSADEARHILGGQGQLWSEYLPDGRQVEYMAYPRAAALAEVLWTPGKLKDYADFSRRLAGHLRRLDALGVNYRRTDAASGSLLSTNPHSQLR